MKLLSPSILFISTLSFLIYSFNNSNGQFSAFHKDGIDKVSFSNGPPLAKTGAPGEGNCTDCHSGNTLSAAGAVDYTFSEAAGYLPSETYNITLTNITSSKNGFQMTILNDKDEAAGTFTAGTNSRIASSGGRNYINHSASQNVTDWDFQWTAPSTDMGSLTVYYAFNETNQNGSNSGDVIYLGQETISTAANIGLTKHQKIDRNYSVFVNQLDQTLNLNYKVANSSKTILQLIDMSGKLVTQKELGIQGKGKYQEKFNLSEHNLSGTYIVSLFQDNLVFNRKVLIP